MLTSSSDPPPSRTQRPLGPSHASRLLSHRVKMPRFTSTSHMASATLAEPMRKLSLHAGLARRSSPTTLWTPTPPRLLLGLLLRVILRVGPCRARIRGHHDWATAVRASRWTGYNIHTWREIRLLARPQACRFDKRQLTLCRLSRCASLPGRNTPSSNRGAYMSHPIFQRKPSANLYACQDQVSCT
jgi:hypothetical protein